jgi:hypothetical protein
MEHMDRHELTAAPEPDYANPGPRSDVSVLSSAVRSIAPEESETPTAVRAAWHKPLGFYDRRQPREYAVTRFG